MKESNLADNEPVIVATARTAVGRKNGALMEWHAAKLFGKLLDSLMINAKVPSEAVEDVVAGCATQVGEQAGNIARTGLLFAGFPVTIPGVTIQRACGSAQQAVHFADNLIRSGVCDVVIAGGVEMMSKTRGANDDTRYGTRHPQELVDRFALPSMGQAAERIADRWDLSRGWLDELSYRSHHLAAIAQDSGALSKSIIPLLQPDGSIFMTDEGIRRDTSIEKLGTLKSAFSENGRITAGNSSQIADGAAAMLLMSAKMARHYGIKPRARLFSQCVVGVDPEIMLTGPIPATQKILERAGLPLEAIDLFEINEAFASVLGAWLKEIPAKLDRVNVNGGSISMGHPLGSSGARLMMIMLDELERRGGNYGLQSMCCGGGMGTATIIETIQ